MAENISVLSRLVNGFQRSVDLAASGNVLVVDSIKIGGATGTALDKTTLDNLLSDQHTHSNKSDLDNVSGTNTGDQDASTLPYTPTTLTDWSGDADPGNADDALDQLASRVKTAEGDITTLEGDSHTHSNKSILDDITAAYTTEEATKLSGIEEGATADQDASEVPFTPAVLTDWSGDADPGNVDDALDQLASRVTTAEGDITTLQGDLADYIPLTQKGANDGVATLDENGKIPAAQLPNSVMEFKGAWNANTNSPTLGDDAVVGVQASYVEQDITWTAVEAGVAGNSIGITYMPYVGVESYVEVVGTAITLHLLANELASTIIDLVSNYPAAAALIEGSLTGSDQVQDNDSTFSLTGGVDAIPQANAGDVYRVSVEGTQDLGSGEIHFYVGDFAIYNGTIWQRSPMADGVVSVNGQTGVVVLDADDIDDTSTTNKFATEAELTKLAGIEEGATADQDASEVPYTPATLTDWSGDADPGNVDDALDQLASRVTTAEGDITTLEGDSHTHSNKSILDDITAAYTTEEAAKLANISVTQAVDLDTMESDIAALKASTVKSLVAGETFAANTTFLVRFALTGETAGRVYKATNAAASTDGKFWVIGVVMNTVEKSAGASMDVVILGSITLGSSDTAFNAADVGKPVWLTTAGGFSITAPSSSDTACYKIGQVETTTKIFVDSKQLTGIN